MIIQHYTSIDSALSICKEKLFYPASRCLLNGDSGLNAIIKGKPFRSQQFEGTEVVINFKWLGAQKKISMNILPPAQPNILYDQLPWRVFIRGPVSIQALKVQYIKINNNNALESYLEMPKWVSFLPSFISCKIKRKSKLNFLKMLRNLYRENDLYIQITPCQ